MKPPDAGRGPVTRRALLGGVAGLAGGRAVIPAAAASDPSAANAQSDGGAPSLTVATRNLYVGVDLSRLFRATSMADVRRIAGEMLDEVEAHPYRARVDGVAAEIEATRPHVVALQEAARIRTQRPGDFDEDPSANAGTEVVDLLDSLEAALADRDLSYDVAAATVTTDFEVPADAEGGTADVRLTDRTALLVREDVETADARTDTFDAALTYPLEGAVARIRRGYCVADVTVDGADVTVAGAHLEPSAADVRLEQAEELLDALPADRPAVLAGDVNSDPDSADETYARLAEAFEDAHATARPDDDGYTCCHDDDLLNEEPALSRRVDVVLHRGDLEPTAVRRVGADPADRVDATVDGETVRVWPSDHAGVVATFAVPAAVTETETAAATETPRARDANATTDDGRDGPLGVAGDGFGLGTALATVAAAAFAWSRRSG